MRPVVWHPEAEKDLLEIVAFVAEHDFQAAQRFGRLTYESAEPLAQRTADTGTKPALEVPN